VRIVQTFILRLLIDPDEPEILRGAIQPVPEGEPQPFVGERELLTLLRRPFCLSGSIPPPDQPTNTRD
jgi:hypothetical protein